MFITIVICFHLDHNFQMAEQAGARRGLCHLESRYAVCLSSILNKCEHNLRNDFILFASLMMEGHEPFTFKSECVQSTTFVTL